MYSLNGLAVELMTTTAKNRGKEANCGRTTFWVIVCTIFHLAIRQQ